MKRYIALLLGILLCFFMAGCGAGKQPYDLSGTAVIEIHAYDSVNKEPFAQIVVDGKEDVTAILENFSSLSLKKMDNVEPSVAGYDLYFRDAAGTQLAKLSLPYGPSPWVVSGGAAYSVQKGSVDVEFLAQLVEIAVSAGSAPDPGSADRGGRPYAPYIGSDVTKVAVTHILSGQSQKWTAAGEQLDTLREWANSLKYEPYADGRSPGDADGGEMYEFVLTEGDYPGFTYVISGPDHGYLLIEDEWFTVSDPSVPPVACPAET